MERMVGLSRRDVLRGMAAAGGGMLLAACGATPTPEVVTETVIVEKEVTVEAAAAEKVTLRLQNWFTETDMWVWNIGLDKARAEIGNLDFNLEYQEYSETAVKVIAAAAAGNPPDVIMAATEHMPIMICQGLLLDLNPNIERDGDVDTDDFGKGVSQGFHQWNHWWGFPYDQSTIGLLYNKDMFDVAGVSYPPGDVPENAWAYEEMVDAAQKLTKEGGEQYGLWWSTSYVLQHHIYSSGGRMFDDDLRKCIINSEESVAGVQAYVDLWHKYKVAPTLAEQGSADVDYFCSNLAAMQIGGQWELQTKNQTCEFSFDVGYMPWVKEQITPTGGSGFALSSTTKYPEEAWQFLKLFTSSDVLAAMVGKTGRGLPGRLSATWAYVESGGGRAKYPNVFVDQLDWSFLDYSVIASYEFEESLARNLEPIYTTGQGSIPDALAVVEEETNAAMDEKWGSCTLDIWGQSS